MKRSRPTWLSASLVFLALLVSCSSQPPAPIEQKSYVESRTASTELSSSRVAGRHKSASYRVVTGDTLYSIAWRFGLDPRQLAFWNSLSDPNRIFVGQSLRLIGPAKSDISKRATTAPTNQARKPRTVETAVVKNRNTTKQLPPNFVVRGQLKWRWPADGKVVPAVSASGSRGLEIKGQRGQPIKAAEAGDVVYGGNGLRGYGQLLIIKHNEEFLSAYAHNEKLLVTEGQRVKSGQEIALMGDSDATEVMLHFEIRKGGTAVEPLQYLPQR
ncbi:MAG: LysM peptidoglycan-binding domain-containing protein [Gammaproteobacteria bacterium]|nr:LysM peptidoglycan-binding domain-containing protein [Gammaproteobacteria bacterium]